MMLSHSRYELQWCQACGLLATTLSQNWMSPRSHQTLLFTRYGLTLHPCGTCAHGFRAIIFVEPLHCIDQRSLCNNLGEHPIACDVRHDYVEALKRQLSDMASRSNAECDLMSEYELPVQEYLWLHGFCSRLPSILIFGC